MSKLGAKKVLLAVASLVVTLSLMTIVAVPPALAEEEPITLKMAYWGESEAPGLGAWLEESAAMYMEEHPEIADIEIVLLEGEAIYPTFLAQAAAGNPPDIQFLWGGVLGLEQAWNGNIQPISDFWTEEDLRHIYCPTRAEGYWNGKQYILPLYMDAWLMAYNKDIFKEAGLDPENPPVYWDEFVAALEKIRDAGYVGTYMGLKDGYMAAWVPSRLGMDYYASITDEHRAVIGEEKLTEKKHAYWWTLWQELLDKNLVNDDLGSITIGEGQDLFLQGKVGIGMSIQPLITSWMRAMGEDKIGVMLSPKMRDALPDGMADQLPVPGADIAIPTAAAHPKEAADFLKFILINPERVNAMFQQTGAFPGSDQQDAVSVTLPTDKLMYHWIQERSGYTYNYNYPGDFETSLYTIGQQLVAGELTPEQAAQAYEDAAVKWRENNPQGVENFKIWIEQPLVCPYE